MSTVGNYVINKAMGKTKIIMDKLNVITERIQYLVISKSSFSV